MKHLSYIVLPLFAALTAAAGCAEQDPCDPTDAVDIDPAGIHHQYVVDSIQVPASPAEANDLGLNLDGDEMGRPDNAFGQVLAVIFNNLDEEDPFNDEVAARILAGELIQLFDVQTTDLLDAGGAGFRGFVGADADSDPSNNLGGDGQFRIRISGDPMGGRIADGELHAWLGTVPIQFALPNVEEPLVLELHSAQVVAYVDQEGMSGKIGGGITEQDVDEVLMPALQFVIEREIEKSCDESGCVENSVGEWLRDEYDLNRDGEISLDEVRTSTLTGALLAPDVDLFCDGVASPRCDGVKDSLSLGLGFTAVPAHFQVPGSN